MGSIRQEITGVKHTSAYNWSYNGTNKKNEKKFRHTTNESLEDVISYLEEQDIKFVYDDRVSMFWIHTKEKIYCYYYTTGRWTNYSKQLFNKHYVAKGIKDFLERFVFIK